MAVIFVIIIIPITLILSAYIGIQIDTQILWQNYDTKLMDATHDAMIAFQLNTIDNDYSANSDSLRRDIKASINTFFTALATNLGTPGASTVYIEQYIPAVLVTLYDGYYIYSPVETEYNNNGHIETKYEHALKPYIQYSMRYKESTCDITVNYSLDNYITVYGYMGNEYISRSGYLIVLNDVSTDGKNYKGTPITNSNAIQYYKEARKFTEWITSNSFSGTTKKIVDVVIPQNAVKSDGIEKYNEFNGNTIKLLDIKLANDPEDEMSDFQGHKREVMRLSIQSNLNNAIYAYNKHTVKDVNFRMPVLTQTDWDKILTNINVISFMQGMPVGTKVYSNYAIVTSTNNKQYVSTDSIYFVSKDEYHKIYCPQLKQAVDSGATLEGYKSIDFEKRMKKDEPTQYEWLHNEKSCYTCIVNPLSLDVDLQTYLNTNGKLKQALYNAIGKERYNLNKTTKLLENGNK